MRSNFCNNYIHRSTFGSTKQISERYKLKDDSKIFQSQQVIEIIPDALDQHMSLPRQGSVMKSCADSEFISPKSITGSVSIPFNFNTSKLWLFFIII